MWVTVSQMGKMCIHNVHIKRGHDVEDGYEDVMACTNKQIYGVVQHRSVKALYSYMHSCVAANKAHVQ